MLIFKYAYYIIENDFFFPLQLVLVNIFVQIKIAKRTRYFRKRVRKKNSIILFLLGLDSFETQY